MNFRSCSYRLHIIFQTHLHLQWRWNFSKQKFLKSANVCSSKDRCLCECKNTDVSKHKEPEEKNVESENDDLRNISLRHKTLKSLSPTRRLQSMLSNLNIDNTSDSEEERNDIKFSSTDTSMKLSKYRGLSPSKRLLTELPNIYWEVQEPKYKNAVNDVTRTANELEINETAKFDDEQNNDITQNFHSNRERHHLLAFTQGEEVLLEFVNQKTGTVLQKIVCLSDDDDATTLISAIHGVVQHSDVLGLTSGSCVVTSRGFTVQVRRSSLREYACAAKLRTVVPHPKVMMSAMYHMGVAPGSQVLDAGSGSGIAALYLSDAVSNTGAVQSYDRLWTGGTRAEGTTQKWHALYNSTHQHAWPDNIHYHRAPVLDVLKDSSEVFDHIFLDVTNPAEIVPNIVSALKHGKSITVYCPSVTRLVGVVDAVEKQGAALHLECMWEETVIQWYLTEPFYTHLKSGLHVVNSQVNTEATSFIMRLRRLTTNKDESCNSQSNDNKFIQDDVACVSLLKQWKHSRVNFNMLLTLKRDEQFATKFGLVDHNDIIGQNHGVVLETFKHAGGIPVYVWRPNMLEYLKIHKVTRLYARGLYMLCGMADIHSGYKVLVTLTGNRFDALVPLLALKVGMQGQVHANIDTKDDKYDVTVGNLLHKLQDLFPHEYAKMADIKLQRSTSDVNSRIEEPLDTILCTDLQQLNTMSACISHLKPGGTLSIFCKSIVNVQGWLEVLQEKRTEWGLCRPEMYEDTENPWIMTRVENPEEKLCTSEWSQMISRPKHNILKKPVYILTWKKS